MYEMIGNQADGTPYKVKFTSNANFICRINEIKADPNRRYPHIVTGTRAEDKLPGYLKNYLQEHEAGYLQVMPDAEKHKMERLYNLVIRTDPFMPAELGGMISTVNGKVIIISVNGKGSRSEQIASFLHESVHLFRGDVTQSEKTAAEIEAEAEADLVQAARIIISEYERKHAVV